MFLVLALFFAIFVLPDPWRVPAVVIGAALELVETGISIWLTWRAPPKVGAETLVGATGRVTEACRPDGRVRVLGEPWRAHCADNADVDDAIRVVERRGLTLVVEPLEAQASEVGSTSR